LRRSIREHVGGNRVGLAEALLLGDGGAVAPGIRRRFQETGTAHVLAVSGLHLTAGAAAVFLALQGLLLWIPGLAVRGFAARIAALAAVLVASMHAGFVGFGVATTRALTMLVIGLGARSLGGPYDGLSALGVAALVVLALDPASVGSPGFWLSFTAVAGLVMGTGGQSGRASAGKRMLRAAGVAWAVTAPIVAHVFGSVSWGAVFVNLAVVPLVSWLIVPSMLLLATLSWALPDFVSTWMGGVDVLCELLVQTLDALAPLAQHTRVPRPSLAWTLACVIAILGMGWSPTRRFALAGCVGLLLLAMQERGGDGKLHVTFLDVGHGDSAVLVGPDGETLLVDGGGRTGAWSRVGERVVVPALDALGIRRLDGMLLSHPDADHLRGLLAVARVFPVRVLWWSGRWTPSSHLLGLLAHLHMSGTEVREWLTPGSQVEWGRLHLTLLHPGRDFEDGASTNDASLVMRVEHGEHSFLFTGDVEARGESALVDAGLPPSTVVKAPHHGSRTSSGAALIAAASAQHVVFSGDARGRHRIPHADVIARWKDAGARIHRTDQHGAITFVSDGEELVWRH